jgi:hypothetical protein
VDAFIHDGLSAHLLHILNPIRSNWLRTSFP